MRILAAVFAFALTSPFPAAAQVAREVNQRYQTAEGRAEIARSLDAPDRDLRQKPEALIARMNLQAGMAVADIGAGVGYMLPHLSRAVGPTGKVYGEDIQQDFLDQARAKLTREKLSNVQLVLGTETDPKLAPASVDVAVILDVYHHFDYPAKMLAHIRSAIKPGGRLFVIDDYRHGREDHIRLERDDVVKEIEANGFDLLSTSDQIPDEQYILMFERP